MKNILALVFVIIVSIPMAMGRNLGLDISHAQYMTQTGQPYVELYFAVDGNTLNLGEKGENTYFGGIEVVVKFYQDSTFITGDKFRILSPDFTDTLLFTGIYLHQERYSLAKGKYTIKFELFDIHKKETVYNLEIPLDISLGGKEASISALTLLDHHIRSKENSRFSKSGYDLYPMVNSGSYYFTENVKKISYYTEIYNLNEILGQDSVYVLKQYIENRDNEKPSFKHSALKKRKAQPVQPILSGFDISDLASGNYNLVIEILDKKLETVVEKKVSFYRSNPSMDINAEDIMISDLAGTFVFDIQNFDTLYQYISYLYPISDERAQDFQTNLLNERDTKKMQSYFHAFWNAKSPKDPEGQWLKYHKNVKIANRLYKTRLQKGYRSQMGRVFLMYGSPSQIEDRKVEPGLPPYQIWNYFSLQSPYNDVVQTNRIFIFAEFDAATNDYELIHSDAYGELNNRRWRYDLAQGVYGPGGSIDDNGLSDGDGFGSRLNNNIIMQGQGNR